MNNAFLFSSFRRYLFSSPQKHHRGARFVGEGGPGSPGDDVVTDGEGGSVNQWTMEQLMMLRVKHSPVAINLVVQFSILYRVCTCMSDGASSRTNCSIMRQVVHDVELSLGENHIQLIGTYLLIGHNRREKHLDQLSLLMG